MTDELEQESSVEEFYGSKSMRWYQIAAVNQTAEALEDGSKRILIHLPTGAGKTITIAASLSNSRIRAALGVEGDRALRVLFVAHKHRLLTQAERTFTEDSNVEVILQSAFSDIDEDVMKAGWDVTVIDEAHHEAMLSIQYKLDDIGDIPIIGLTATPDRADGTLIKFDTFVSPISREQAVEEGYLAETELYSFVDPTGRNKVQILTSVLDQYIDEMGQTMIFVGTKKEINEIVRVIERHGKTVVGVESQSEAGLNEALDAFSKGEVQFLVSCNRIGEGVDVAGCSDVLLGRQMRSYPMLNQVIGRAARPDCECRVWELINPLKNNLDTTVVVGTPKTHTLNYKFAGQWMSEEFNYSTYGGETITNGITMGVS